MTDLASLVVKRDQLKAHITRFNTFLSNFDENSLIEELVTRLDRLETILPKFEETQNEIEHAYGVIQDDERETFENLFYQAIGKAKNIISNKVFADNAVSSINGQTNSNNNNGSAVIQSKVKLPQISLPDFHGYYNQWMTFHDTFNSLIHKNEHLNDTERFYYLKSCLKGEAAQVIQSIEITNANYNIAWQMLKERFENKKLIIHTHVKAMFELNPVKIESHSLLRKLVDNFNKNLRALHALEQPTDTWDTLLVYILSSKLDALTKREWEESVDKIVAPTITQLTEFITRRCQLLETVENKNKPQKSLVNRDEKAFTHLVTQKITCSFCKEQHPDYRCEKFEKLTNSEKWDECKSSGCKHCNAKHNSLLHNQKQNENSVVENTVPNSVNSTTVNNTLSTQTQAQIVTHCSQTKTQVLLATAKINICDVNGSMTQCRALLDSGSVTNFMTKSLADKLNLKTINIQIPVVGINNSLNNISSKTETTMYSLDLKYKRKSNFLLVNKITENMPQITFDSANIEIPDNITLADDNFNVAGPVDILLGADIFFDILCVGLIKSGKNKPIFQKTKLGWVISGVTPMTDIHKSESNAINCYLNISNETLHKQLETFWNIETCKTETKNYTNEESECEAHFVKTFKRDSQGRFVVRLPVRDIFNKLGESEQIAERRFHSLENKLQRDEHLKQKYVEFMNEYETLGHMTQINLNHNETNTETNNYLPHHGVIKADSTTTKLRVVFDASAKTTSGLSLNDVLKVGPVIQRDLFSVVLKFRKHNIAITADIEKMYRQVNLSDHDRNFQRIVWRAESSEKLKHYQLNTVTYGTASASFLAVRSLHQTALDHENEYPHASKVILQDFYVDDLLSGANSIEEALLLKTQLTDILGNAGFPLRKWCSNNKLVLENKNVEKLPKYAISDNKNVKTLGLSWNPNTDWFHYSVSINTSEPITKRQILAAIAKIFDPLGLIGPTTVQAKIILQKLWQSQVEWDESIPSDLYTAWQQFREQLILVNNIEIPRQVTSSNFVQLELHGFSDASERAYGACIYVRTTNANGDHVSKLLCAKSRIAPLKTITLPRLELCAAVLLAQLMTKAEQALDVSIDNKFFWCDSTIVLSWINAEPCTWKTFVSNRITEIQELTQIEQWRHVSSELNPADIISRGSSPESLSHNKLWWHGPDFLMTNSEFWPILQMSTVSDISEKRKTVSLSFLSCVDQSTFERFSSFTKLHRVVAYMYKFTFNANPKNLQKRTGELNSDELRLALIKLIQLAQLSEFHAEIQCLLNKKSLANSSKLLSLNPFLDSDGLIRVGGRIKHAKESYNTQHPILLPAKHELTKKLVELEHKRLLHAGPQAVLASLRRKYWPIHGRNIVKAVIHKCITCFKANPTKLVTQMGNLPEVRVVPARPFSTVGIDYAGPILIKDGSLKTRKMVKSYVCIFVCFVSKAVHIELAGDLSTETFFNAFKRFVARRGLCKNVYSDNGTNFIGAKNELQKICKYVNDMSKSGEMRDYLLKNEIEWHLIPPGSPHFGGLWEAAVKSTKFHLTRVVGNAYLTYENLYSVLCQIEAILNSRPLTQLSSDPNDLTPLTPGHFLIGDCLTAIPERDLGDVPTNRMKLFERTQSVVQHFWRRWSSEYLTSLQPRSKWKKDPGNSIKIGALVVLREDNLPVLRWKLGRIVEVYPGDDGVIRVVSVKTNGGIFKRSVTKLSILPIPSEGETY